MSQVFISYSQQDIETVDRIANAISATGMEVWLDRNEIRAGETWRIEIVEAIDACAVFVLVLSPNSATLEDVRTEIDLAQDAGCTIIPFMIAPVKIPVTIRYQLAGLGMINASSLGFEQALEQLVEVVRLTAAKKKD